MGSEIGLGEDASYELFGQLVDKGYVDPGRVLGAGGAMPGHTSRCRTRPMPVKKQDSSANATLVAITGS